MMSKSELVIRIPQGSAEANVSYVDTDGISKQKLVMVSDVVSSLMSSFKFSTGLLPNNTRFFSGTKTSYTIGIETPPRIRRFLKSSSSTGKLPGELKIPFPTCLFVFEVKGGRITDTKVFALRGLAQREVDTVCRFPFGNTYNDGRVCWGSNKLPAIPNPLALVSIVATFFDAPFNGDLFDSSTIQRPADHKHKLMDFWAMLVYLNKKEVFPQEMLYNLKIKIGKLMREK
jgi:hypothetical protein